MDALQRRLERVAAEPEAPPAWGLGLKTNKLKNLKRLIGAASAEAVKTAKRRRPQADLYPDLEAEAKTPAEAGPLTGKDYAYLDECVFSRRTLATRRSHLRTICKFLHVERPETKSVKDAAALRSHFTVSGIKLVAACLLKRQVKSGANYLSSWRGFVCRQQPVPEVVKQALADVKKTFGKLPHRVVQAPELDIEQWGARLEQEAPVVPGGPVYPYMTCILMALFMLRGLAARSLRNKNVKVKEKERTVSITLHVRKANQEGRPKEVELPCVCEKTQICPFCIAKKFEERMKEKWKVDGGYFVNVAGRQVSQRALRLTFGELGRQQRLQRVARPHSARLSGARFWYRQNASLTTICSIGDWADERTLKYYLGAMVKIAKLKQEIAETLKVADVGRMIQQVVTAALASQASSTAAESAPKEKVKALENELSMVYRKRQPHRWHKIGCMRGPLYSWLTACGEIYNSSTMTLQLFVERRDGAVCERCRKKTA